MWPSIRMPSNFQGLFKNEYQGLKFTTNEVGGSQKHVSGEQILRKIWQADLSYSKWVDLGILLGMIVLYRVLFLVIIKTSEKVKPIVASFISVPTKQTVQVMENPKATPLHGEVV